VRDEKKTRRVIMPQRKPFFELPYSERQFIVFAGDEVVEANEKAEALNAEDWKYFVSAEAYIDYIKSQIGPVTQDLLWRINGLLRSYLAAKKEGIKLRLVERNLAASFQLPPGHPRDHTVYVGHPAQPQRYMMLADFHREVFQHKFSEIISILLNLGARDIHVKSMKGWGLDFLISLDPVHLSLPVNDGGFKSCQELQGNVEQVVLLHTAPDIHTAPSLPESVLWYPFEPTWKWVGEGRMKFGLDQYVVDLGYREDYDVNEQLKVKLEKAGFSLGGDLEKQVATLWRLFGQFWPQ
ncbi:MAG TPA: hypothetical protein VN611_13500, partial [Patescibacteria group bacterium]|nr:hypothetical protein [Patescibacteria group bacterium]